MPNQFLDPIVEPPDMLQVSVVRPIMLKLCRDRDLDPRDLFDDMGLSPERCVAIVTGGNTSGMVKRLELSRLAGRLGVEVAVLCGEEPLEEESPHGGGSQTDPTETADPDPENLSDEGGVGDPGWQEVPPEEPEDGSDSVGGVSVAPESGEDDGDGGEDGVAHPAPQSDPDLRSYHMRCVVSGNVHALAEEMDIAKKDVGPAVDYSKSFMGNLRLGAVYLTPELLGKLARYLGTTVEWLKAEHSHEEVVVKAGEVKRRRTETKSDISPGALVGDADVMAKLSTIAVWIRDHPERRDEILGALVKMTDPNSCRDEPSE